MTLVRERQKRQYDIKTNKIQYLVVSLVVAWPNQEKKSLSKVTASLGRPLPSYTNPIWPSLCH
jgi:hypothetical protein